MLKILETKSQRIERLYNEIRGLIQDTITLKKQLKELAESKEGYKTLYAKALDELSDCKLNLNVSGKWIRELTAKIVDYKQRDTQGRFTADERPQKVMVMEYMNAYGSISQYEATTKLKICCLAERIRDLKEEGVTITDQWISKNGKRFKQYSLK